MIAQDSSERYVLITPARNEEAYIENTIQSVVAQTIPPQKWIIVSNGSTDRTEEIVSRYAAEHDFIELLRTDGEAKRSFESKVNAISIGYEQVRSIDHTYVGMLDADVSFQPTYFESIMEKFKQNLGLGIAGGLIYERHDEHEEYVRKITNTDWSVSGAIQMFRRECYEQIGGYVPVRGGVDAVAEVMARMKGWKVKAFPEFHVLHHRRTGAAKGNVWRIFFSWGVENFLLGYHFPFFLAKCLYRSKERPYLLGSFLMLCGYCWSFLHRLRRQVSPEFVRYLRKEQLNRLWCSLLFLKRSEHG